MASGSTRPPPGSSAWCPLRRRTRPSGYRWSHAAMTHKSRFRLPSTGDIYWWHERILVLDHAGQGIYRLRTLCAEWRHHAWSSKRVPTYGPDKLSRFWQVVAALEAPDRPISSIPRRRALRALKCGKAMDRSQATSRQSIRLLGTVGEPINPRGGPGCGTYRRGRRTALPDRRYLVAPAPRPCGILRHARTCRAPPP